MARKPASAIVLAVPGDQISGMPKGVPGRCIARKMRTFSACVGMLSPLVGIAVFVREAPRVADAPRDKIIEGVGRFVARSPVADFEINRRAFRAVHQVMALAARWKADTHATQKDEFVGPADQCDLAVQNVNKLILVAVTVLKGRDGARLQRR